jgi:hypothetical protein
MNIANQLLNRIAWLAIRIWPPVEAKRRVDALGSWLGPLDIEEAERALAELYGGSCLTRALALAARVRDAQIVIGARCGGAAPFYAHAWVESRGQAIGSVEGVVELGRIK